MPYTSTYTFVSFMTNQKYTVDKIILIYCGLNSFRTQGKTFVKEALIHLHPRLKLISLCFQHMLSFKIPIHQELDVFYTIQFVWCVLIKLWRKFSLYCS